MNLMLLYCCSTNLNIPSAYSVCAKEFIFRIEKGKILFLFIVLTIHFHHMTCELLKLAMYWDQASGVIDWFSNKLLK